MSDTLRILIAGRKSEAREALQEVLARLKHQVFCVDTGRQLVDLCRALEPHLLVTEVHLADTDGLEAAAEANRHRPIPVIVVADHHQDDFLARAQMDHLAGYFVKPVKQADLEVAIRLAVSHFEQFQALRKEVAKLRQTLDERKVIERAKGVLMRRVGVGEEEAYRRLRKRASDKNEKLAEVAYAVLAAEESFQALEAGH